MAEATPPSTLLLEKGLLQSVVILLKKEHGKYLNKILTWFVKRLFSSKINCSLLKTYLPLLVSDSNPLLTFPVPSHGMGQATTITSLQQHLNHFIVTSLQQTICVYDIFDV